jgi:hypothetical protein
VAASLCVRPAAFTELNSNAALTLLQYCPQDVFATPLAAAVLPAPGDKGREGASGEAAASYYDLVRASVGAFASAC